MFIGDLKVPSRIIHSLWYGLTLIECKHRTGKFVRHQTENMWYDPNGQVQYGMATLVRLMPYLMAVEQVHRENPHRTVLFVREGTHVSDEFLSQWQTHVRSAPSDWRVLQLEAGNPIIRKHMDHMNSNDAWITWQPEHTSIDAFLMNRDGMETLLKSTLVHLSATENTREPAVWSLQEEGLLLPQEVLYFLSQNSYTSTNTNILAQTTDIPAPLPNRLPPNSESIVVLMNARIKTQESLTKELSRIKIDAKAMCISHAVCDWVVNTVLLSSELLPALEKEIADLPSNVYLRLQISEEFFNKFEIVNATLGALHNRYDSLVFKDNDQRIAGMPWSTFVDKSKDAVIAGPVRQCGEESLARFQMKKPRQAYRTHDAREWKKDSAMVSFQDIRIEDMPMLEMYFVKMNMNFAYWYFSQLIDQEFLATLAAWSTDTSWCGAAKEYRVKGSPTFSTTCALIPVVSSHEDARQIEHSRQFAQSAKQSLRRNSQRFPTWVAYTSEWKKAMKYKTLGQLRRQCGRLLKQTNFTLSQCSRAICGSGCQ